MVTSSKVYFMYPSVTETNTEHYTLIMYISMFWCFFNVLLFSWLVFIYFMLLLRSWSTKHANKKVDYVMNNITKIMSKLLRSAVEISYLQQWALLVATLTTLHTSQTQTNELIF